MLAPALSAADVIVDQPATIRAKRPQLGLSELGTLQIVDGVQGDARCGCTAAPVLASRVEKQPLSQPFTRVQADERSSW